MLDSEKNLRVLWVRALLAAAGELKDDVASELLPSASRWVVSAPLARTIWAPALPKLEWIKQRTEFIDETVDSFLAANAGASPQVVLIGAGYDTRALRYRTSAARFFEVDLPSVLPVKEAMATRFLAAEGGAARSVGAEGRALGVDLNKATMAPPGVFAQLSGLGLDRSLPTLVVSEATRRARARAHACTRARTTMRTTLARPQLPTRPALHSLQAVLFYLSPPAKRALLEDAGNFVGGNAASALVLTDNLAPFVRSPRKEDAAGFLSPLGLDLKEHDTLWGGAIQFVRADGAAGSE